MVLSIIISACIKMLKIIIRSEVGFLKKSILWWEGSGRGEERETSHQNLLQTLSLEAGLKWGIECRPTRLLGFQLKTKSSATL